MSNTELIEQLDAFAVGKESGLSEFQFPLNGLETSASLPAGQQYILKPVFRTSMNGGEDVYLLEEYYPITILGPSKVNSPEAKENIKIINQADGINIILKNVSGDAQITMYSMNGQVLYKTATTSNPIFINKALVPSTGIFIVSVITDKLHRTEKVVLIN